MVKTCMNKTCQIMPKVYDEEEQTCVLGHKLTEEWVCAKCGSSEIANDDFGSPDEIRCQSCYNGE